jgi:hypothetical protein
VNIPWGYFVYDATGHVHIQIMRVPPLAPFPEANFDAGKLPSTKVKTGRLPKRSRRLSASQESERVRALDAANPLTSKEPIWYARWIVEAWERLLTNHSRNLENPQNASIGGSFRFDNLPAMMRVRVTTPNVLKALRQRDPGAAKPYNFAHSPILLEEFPECTLVAPASKRLKEWLTRDYTEIHTGDVVKLGSRYRDKTLTPQTISHTIWKHFLHREDKSLGPDCEPCSEHTHGLLKRRPVVAMLPFEYLGKEVERRAQEGEDVAVLEGEGPIRYGSGRKAKTRSADPGLIVRARRYGLRELMRVSKASQHSVQRFLAGSRVHPQTRARLKLAIEDLEKAGLKNAGTGQ